LSNLELAELLKKMKFLQRKGGILILLTFQVLNKDKLRRRELSTALGAKISREKGGLLSDRTLDKRLKGLTENGFLESEMDPSQYPPAKYYELTSKGKKAGKILNELVRQV